MLTLVAGCQGVQGQGFRRPQTSRTIQRFVSVPDRYLCPFGIWRNRPDLQLGHRCRGEEIRAYHSFRRPDAGECRKGGEVGEALRYRREQRSRSRKGEERPEEDEGVYRKGQGRLEAASIGLW